MHDDKHLAVLILRLGAVKLLLHLLIEAKPFSGCGLVVKSHASRT